MSSNTITTNNMILLELNKGCQKHQQACHAHSRRKTLHCTQLVETLGRILPSLTGDVCPFYQSILHGTFCPHSRNLLRGNGSVNEIYPRVQTILTQALQHPPSNPQLVYTTLAQLLASVREERDLILQDLIATLTELTSHPSSVIWLKQTFPQTIVLATPVHATRLREILHAMIEYWLQQPWAILTLSQRGKLMDGIHQICPLWLHLSDASPRYAYQSGQRLVPYLQQERTRALDALWKRCLEGLGPTPALWDTVEWLQDQPLDDLIWKRLLESDSPATDVLWKNLPRHSTIATILLSQNYDWESLCRRASETKRPRNDPAVEFWQTAWKGTDVMTVAIAAGLLLQVPASPAVQECLDRCTRRLCAAVAQLEWKSPETWTILAACQVLPLNVRTVASETFHRVLKDSIPSESPQEFLDRARLYSKHPSTERPVIGIDLLVDGPVQHETRMRLLGRSPQDISYEYWTNPPIKEDNPVWRLLMWQSMRWKLTQETDSDFNSILYLSDFMAVAFRDENRFVREYCAQHIGSIAGVDRLWGAVPSHRPVPARDVAIRENVQSVWKSLDQVLQQTGNDTTYSTTCPEEMARSATRALLSICGSVPSSLRASFYPMAMERILQHFWGPRVGLEVAAASYLEMSRVRWQGPLIPDECMEDVIRCVVREALILKDASNKSSSLASRGVMETQYRYLESLLNLLVPRLRGLGTSSAEEIASFYDRSLPFIIGHLVQKQEYDILQVSCGFKPYLQTRGNRIQANSSRQDEHGIPNNSSSELILRNSTFITTRVLKSSQWARRLGDQTRDICLAPFFVERILPVVFLDGKNESLQFFVEVALQNKMTLKTILHSREQLVLKGLVLGLTKPGVTTLDATQALQTAALLRIEELDEIIGSQKSARSDQAKSLAVEWISSHFMYLLVNAVQYRWATRTIDEKLHSIRCLSFILTFLNSTDAPKYIPQIMASINTAISTSTHDRAERIHVIRLRYLSVRVLSSLVHLVAEPSVSAVGNNLTGFVVSLIPVLDGEENLEVIDGDATSTCSAAVEVLMWLTSGQIGRKLAPSFKDIPFLPSYAVLDPIRVSLQKLGVDFDRLDVWGSQGTQSASQTRVSVPSDTVSLGGESSVSNDAQKRIALRRRLDLLCPLLVDESASVRKAVVDHLTSLLRGNRQLFHALVESEGSASIKHFVTVPDPNLSGSLRGTVTDMVDTVLAQSIRETDDRVKQLLAVCIGEIGAIGPHLLEDSKPPASETNSETYSWRLDQPPWQSRPARYELQLVTKDLVVALKASQTSAEQHKIVYTIQQVLVLLDQNAPAVDAKVSESVSNSKQEMSSWLSSKLTEAGVLDIVGPFWHSEFKEGNQFNAKSPPFFCSAIDYYSWVSSWCGYMVQSSYLSTKSQWSLFFYACRTALRSKAGLGVAEFLLPLLVLDRVCFGSGQDKAIVIREFSDVMTKGKETSMSLSERQKAVNLLFIVVDTFRYWSEAEVERNHGRSRSSSGSAGRRSSVVDGNWPLDDSILGIEDIVREVPFTLQSHAAAEVGMYARSLQLLEMASRATVTEEIYNIGEESKGPLTTKVTAAGKCPGSELELMKDVLVALGNYETVSALSADVSANPQARVLDSIRLKEASNNWEAALQDYERANQIDTTKSLQSELQRGTLRCLLELGQLESTLNQVKGYIQSADDQAYSTVAPFAAEAAWRLGRWNQLEDLVSVDGESSSEDMYQLQLGRVMLGLHSDDYEKTDSALLRARSAVMESLVSSGREGYGRAYPHVVRLQILGEIENIIPLKLGNEKISSLHEGVSDLTSLWEMKLGLMASSGASTVINARLAMSRLIENKLLEGSLFINSGKRAREERLYNIAQNSFAQAQSVLEVVTGSPQVDSLRNSLLLEVAKLKYETGDTTGALRMLGQDSLTSLLDLEDTELEAEVLARAGRGIQIFRVSERDGSTLEDEKLVRFFVETALQATEWMMDDGLKGAREMISRFRTINKIAPDFEKGHFLFARYVDSILQTRIEALKKKGNHHIPGADEDSMVQEILADDTGSQKYTIMILQHYVKALSLDSRHIYQALPRLLSLWFEFTSADRSTTTGKKEGKFQQFTLRCVIPQRRLLTLAEAKLQQAQSDANLFIGQNYRNIPAQAFYTAIPQLISRVTHADKDTASIVRGVLKRVLVKFPEQSMWPLAVLVHSKASDRRKVGESIFTESQKALLKSNRKSHGKILVAAKSLFRFFNELARYTAKNDSTQVVSMRPWKGEVELSEFLPPVLGALSVSPDSVEGGFPKDPFPRQVPRMRAFAQRVTIMSSKAKPKKIKAYVVTADSRLSTRKVKADGKSENDIGELHFLIKQEARGDLRKDARVQDLNNVINRLMSTSGKSRGAVLGRRLHLRTFVVTCLSEDTGMIEWVPSTTSLRSLVAKAYNPQASSFSPRRRGNRLVSLGDPTLRSIYEKKCQPLFFSQGSLKKASALFEKLVLDAYPPLLYWWFVQKYHDPHEWYEARLRFTLSAAIWSAVGHIIGLGDRHSENILVDIESGACVHVDFDCIFDKGLHLPKPEIVPFRLTSNMIDSFGPTGADGVFRDGLKSAMTVLRDNRDTLLSVLEPFLKDPVIDWRRYRSHQRAPSKSDAVPSTQDRQKMEAKRFINVIDERLQGIYNLRNPNLKKIRRTDGFVGDEQDDELTHLIPLSVDGQVHKMIEEATSSENLVQMYVGWMPWV